MNRLQSISLEQFLLIFRATQIVAHFRVPLALDCGPALIGRIRGAWGGRLMRLAKEGDSNAQSILRRYFSNKDGIQKPFVIKADESGGHLTASLSLFGWQDAVRDSAFDALIGALSEDGLLIREGVKQRHIALTLLDAHWDVSTGLQVPSIRDSVRIKFLTPCKLGSGGTIGTRYSDIWVSCALRTQAIANWHGCDLGIDLGEVRSLAQAMLYDDSGLFGSRWERWSSRTGETPRAMMGLSGELCMRQWRQELTPLLVLGEAANVGAETAFGLGRFAAF